MLEASLKKLCAMEGLPQDLREYDLVAGRIKSVRAKLKHRNALYEQSRDNMKGAVNSLYCLEGFNLDDHEFFANKIREELRIQAELLA
jgi:hypothetical protein